MIVSDASFDQGVYSSYTERIAAIEYADECYVQPIRFFGQPRLRRRVEWMDDGLRD